MTSRFFVISALLTVAGCEKHDPVTRHPFEITRTPVYVPGPLPPVPVHVVLINAQGKGDTLGGREGASAAKENDTMVCLWDHGLHGPDIEPPRVVDSGRMVLAGKSGPPLHATYTAVELWAERPVRVQEVSWWSGQRLGFP